MAIGAILGAIGSGLLSGIAGRSSGGGETSTVPWSQYQPYLVGNTTTEQRLRDGVTPIWSNDGDATPLSFEAWASRNGITPDYEHPVNLDSQQQEYDRYLASNPGQTLLNPASDFEEYQAGTPGILPEAADLYSQGALTPDQVALNEQHTGNQLQLYNDLAQPTLDNAWNTYDSMAHSNFTPDQVNQIAPDQIDAVQNTFEPNAQAQAWNPERIDNVQNMQSAQLGDPTLTSAVDVGPVAQMQAAQNQGYTPTGQVADFMNGGAYNNPMLDRMYDSAARKVGQQFNEQIMSGITDNAVGTGGLGGSRQGIAEGIAARGAADALGDLANNMYGNAYNLGFGAMSGLTSQQMAGDINRLSQNTQNQQAANAQNAGWQNQGIFQNASNQQMANNTNAGIRNQFATNQAGFDQQANAANAGYGNQAIFANAGYGNQAGQWNANAGNQFAMANQNLGFNQAENNANRQQSVNGQNVANDMAAQGQNAANTFNQNTQNLNAQQSNFNNQLNANNALTGNMNMMNGLYGSTMNNLGMPNSSNWQNLQNYANIVNGAQSGQTTTTQQPYNPMSNIMGGAMAGYSLFGGNNGGVNLQGQSAPLYNNSAFVGMM